MPRPVATDSPPDAPLRHLDGVALAVFTIILRVPALAAPVHLTVDDGVYGASAVAMRHGATPFSGVFSSQGPLFLPLIRLADLAGIGWNNAPRLVGVLSGVAIVLAGWFAVAHAVPPTRARLAATITGVLLAVSGSVMWTTGPLAADGPAAAFSTWAVVLGFSYQRRPRRAVALAIGLLAGSAFAIKSLLVVPALIVAWFLVARTRRWIDAAIVIAVAGAETALLSLAFGPARVWQQWFAYHLEDTRVFDPIGNIATVGRVFVTREWPLLVVGVFTIAWATANRALLARSPLDLPCLAWAGAVAVVLIGERSLWQPHLVFLVIPLSVMVGAHAPPLRVSAPAFALAVLPWWFTLQPLLTPAPYRGNDAALLRTYRALPAEAEVISQSPGIVWQGNRRVPSWLVDTSALRIDTPIPSIRIDTATLARAAASPRVCAVVVDTTTFVGLDDSLRALGYERTAPAGGWVRPSCRDNE